MDLPIEHKKNGTRGTFYMERSSEMVSRLNYRLDGNIMTIDHTETKPSEQGKGLAGKLVDHSVTYARKNNYSIAPRCPYAQAQFDKHPEYADVKA